MIAIRLFDSATVVFLLRVSPSSDEKLDWIMETLKRMEARQIELKTEVDDVQEHEAPAVGSFGNTGKKA
jgi:hypothetical protein